MCEVDELGLKLGSCDEIVLVYSKIHGGLLQFYCKDFFSGELFLKCGALLNEVVKYADLKGNISSSKVKLLKDNLEKLKSMATATIY